MQNTKFVRGVGGWMGEVHLVDAKNRPTTAESLIGTPKEHIPDPQLTKGTSTHNAWFDSDIQICALENFCMVRFEDLIDCTEFSVSDSLQTLTVLQLKKVLSECWYIRIVFCWFRSCHCQ